MASTSLFGLDDHDIPQDFVDELAEAEWLERKADAAALLNALLLAGWVPPSKQLSVNEVDRLRAKVDNLVNAMRWDAEQIDEARRILETIVAAPESPAERREAAQLWLSLNAGNEVVR